MEKERKMDKQDQSELSPQNFHPFKPLKKGETDEHNFINIYQEEKMENAIIFFVTANKLIVFYLGY